MLIGYVMIARAIFFSEKSTYCLNGYSITHQIIFMNRMNVRLFLHFGTNGDFGSNWLQFNNFLAISLISIAQNNQKLLFLVISCW